MLRRAPDRLDSKGYAERVSDAALRELSRRVEAEGSAAARLALAAALERAGRQEEALRALLPARDDAAVRTEVARLGGRVEVAIRRQPIVRWRVPVSPRLRLVSASLLGVVSLDESTKRVTVFDIDTGHERWSSAKEELFGVPQVVGKVLITWEHPHVVARDLWTGVELHRTGLQPGRTTWVEARAGQLLGGTADEVWARELADPALPPGNELWRTRVALSPDRVCVWACGTKLVLPSSERNTWLVIDRQGGSVAGRLMGHVIHSDEEGALVRTPDGHLTSFPDPLAARRWWKDDAWLPCVGSGVVVIERDEGDDQGLVVVERRSGRRLSCMLDAGEAVIACVVADHTGFISQPYDPVTGSGGIGALTFEGRALWYHRSSTDIVALLPVPWALVADDGVELFCLEEGPA